MIKLCCEWWDWIEQYAVAITSTANLKGRRVNRYGRWNLRREGRRHAIDANNKGRINDKKCYLLRRLFQVFRCYLLVVIFIKSRKLANWPHETLEPKLVWDKELPASSASSWVAETCSPQLWNLTNK